MMNLSIIINLLLDISAALLYFDTGGDYMETGKKIKQCRKEKGWTQRQLAEKLGVTAAMVGLWENGSRNPKPATLEKIADALGTVSAYLDSNLTHYHTIGEGAPDTPEGWKTGVLIRTSSGVRCVQLDTPEGQMLYYFTALNEDGRNEAIKRLAEMAQLPQYTE